MVDRISVQIALEGGDAIERQLADIGQAGQKAFADISDAADKAGGFQQLKPEEVTTKLNDMGLAGTKAFTDIQAAVTKATGLEKIVQGVAAIENAFIGLARVAVPVVGALAAAFVAMIPSTIKTAEAINKVSNEAVKFGQSFEQFKKTREELAKVGIDAQGAASGLAAYQKVLGTPTTHVVDVLTATGEALRYVSQSGKLAADEIPKFRAALATMPDTLARTNLAIQQMGEEAGIQLIQGLRRAEGSMSDAERKSYDLGQAVTNLKQKWADFGGVTLAPLITIGVNALAAALEGVDNWLKNLSWASVLNLANMALNPVRTLIEACTTAAFNFGRSIAGIVWENISSAGVAAWNALSAAIGTATAKVVEFLAKGGKQLQQSGSDSGPLLSGFAGGGLLGGRGTGTSDSNLAWVSRGEHIMPAMAVAQPGVLGFLEALRRSGGNLTAVLNGMGRFALGGMVPRMAGGGMSNVTIAFPGLPPIGGLHAPSAVIDQLRHAAALAQVRSGGRKPSRYT